MSREHLTQTTAEVTLDTVSVCAIMVAIDDQIDRLTARLVLSTNPRKRTNINNTLTNLKAGKASMEKVFRTVLEQPMFTPEYQAVIDARLEKAS